MVTSILKTPEEVYPDVASSLVPIFFLNGIRIKEDDREFWRSVEERRKRPDENGALIYTTISEGGTPSSD